jgi:hypothetical protein
MLGVTYPSRIDDVAAGLLDAAARDGEPLVRKSAAQCAIQLIAQGGTLAVAVLSSGEFLDTVAKLKNDVDWEVRWQVYRGDDFFPCTSQRATGYSQALPFSSSSLLTKKEYAVFRTQAMRLAAVLLSYPCAFSTLSCGEYIQGFMDEELPIRARACDMIKELVSTFDAQQHSEGECVRKMRSSNKVRF